MSSSGGRTPERILSGHVVPLVFFDLLRDAALLPGLWWMVLEGQVSRPVGLGPSWAAR